MFFLKLIGVLLIISGGSAMTLHILKELKFIEISLWFAAISLFVVFLGKIYSSLVAKLNFLSESVNKIAGKIKA